METRPIAKRAFWFDEVVQGVNLPSASSVESRVVEKSVGNKLPRPPHFSASVINFITICEWTKVENKIQEFTSLPRGPF